MNKDLPPRPTLAKMCAVKERSQTIGEFIEWLNENGMQVCRLEGYEDSFRDEYTPIRESTEQLLANHFGIDLNEAENERRALLDYIRECNDC